MKVVFCFLAIMVAYVACETCSVVGNCASTSCSGDFTKECASGMCVCTPNSNQGTCSSQNDCTSLHCDHHQGANDVHCVDGLCHCGHPQNGGPGGPGGPPVGK